MKIFPSNQERLITIAIVAFLSGIAIGLSAKLEAKEFFASVVTLVAAFMGAYSAFLLQNSKQKKEQTALRVESGNKSIFNLIRSYNTFLAFKKQFVDPHIDNPGRFVAIPPSVGFDGKSDFDFHSLAYLFELEDPNVLGELSSFQAEVQATIAVIQERSYMHMNGVQPSLEKVGFVEGNDIAIGDIKNALGERLTAMMIQGTDQMIEGIDSILKDAETLIERLHRIHFKNYKGHKILRMEKMKLNKQMQPTPKNGTAD